MNRLPHSRLVFVLVALATLTFVSLAYSSGNRLGDPLGVKSFLVKARPTTRAPQSQEIAPEGLQQIAALIAEKESRTPEQRKMSSALLQALRESRGQQMTAGVSLEPANLNRDSAGLVLVDITATVTDALIENIKQLGGDIIFPSVEYKAIRARVPLSSVETIAGYSAVTFIRQGALAKTNSNAVLAEDSRAVASTSQGRALISNPFLAPPRHHLSVAEREANVRAQLVSFLTTRAAAVAPFIGKANSQGDKAHQADTAKAQYGFAGEGIRIGVMSDSFNYLGGAALDVAGGDLPGPGNPFGNTTPVTVVQDLPSPNGIIPGSDEGRAMVQIVHDLAPKAQLFFASAFISEAGFATNIKRLRDAPNNCDIVIDDVSYSDEGVFQDSIVAQAVNYVTASGGMYFSSAGNEGSVDRATASVWEGDYNDAGSTFVVPGNSKSGTVHNFGTVGTPVNGNILLSSSGFVYSLDWSDPLGASTNDYDLFVVNTAGTTVKAASTNIQNGTIDPHEEIGSTAFTRTAGDRLVIFKSSGAAVRALSLNAEGGRLTVFTVGNTHGHACAADAFGVAAAAASAANTVSGVFTSASRVETFSSDGPRRIFYNVNGTPVTPGNILFATNGGVVRQKPDITAADGVATSGNSLGSGLNPFSGTSAAAPHAGAIAALIKSANPSLTPAQIRTIITGNSIPIEVAGAGAAPNPVAGYGIMNANAEVLAAMSQQADLTVGTVTPTEGSVKNNNGVIEPGEYANIVIQLSNPSLTNATGVNATLTTSTPGVTIIQGAASYGSIPSGGSASNTGTPFIIGISPSYPCGQPITLTVTATLTNGSPVTSSFTVNVGGAFAALVPTISGTLSLTPPTGAGFTSTGGTKTGTLARNAIQSTCAVPKAAPLSGTGFSATTGGRYAAFTFTNPSANSQCVSVSATSSSANNLQTAAFNSGGFVPATSLSAGTNYLADSGTRATTMAYTFIVPGSQAFTVAIYDATTGGTAAATTYTLTVSLGTCNAGPACTPVTVTPGSIAGGTTGTPYSQSFGATGGSGSYTFSLSGGLPNGLTFSGSTLSGTPTQAGTFPITITAADAACPGGSASYSLVIAGNAPASVTATGGNGQTVLPSTAFPIPLQATVRDAGNVPLNGVAVTFTAPSSGPSGTFPGGATSVVVVTTGGGVATAPTFTANSTAGSYAVTASVNGVSPASFNLTNSCPGSFVVTTTADSGAGSLREVINNACAGGVVTFAGNVTGTITLTSGELLISKALTITGPGAGLAVSGNHLNRVFQIASGTGNIVNITGLTIKDGSTKANGTDFYGGGGVLIVNGTANLTDCLIFGNTATSSGNPSGGGVDNEGGVVTITRCAVTNNTITNNVASNGAFYLGGGVFHEGTSMTIDTSTISGNVCGPYGAGGGLAFFTSVTLTNSTVFGNSANVGGNIARLGGTLTFKNNIIAGGTLTGVNGAGVDINGTGFSSQDYNLIQTTTGGTITGTTTHNITGASPNLLSLGNYGGPTPTHLPAPNSPVINVGDTALVSGTDQRGLPRLIGGQADIGAVETNFALSATGGTPQSTVINTNFGSPLQATVTESGNAASGVTVTFTAPGSGASGVFTSSGTAIGTGTTNGSGVANSSTFTANGTTGSYSVSGSIGSAIPNVTYNLTNTGAAANITATAGTPQSALGGQPYATALQATVLDSSSAPVNGQTVTFTVVPNAGSGATFPGNATSATATTNINGQATAPTLTANNIGGTFTVNATVPGAGSPAVFNLTVCAIACPSNVTTSTDANVCTAVVSYTTPSTAAGCGTVTCAPASGSTFVKGTTTVTCTLNPGSVTCSFTVTVNDTQNPSITCPANIVKSTDPNQCSAVATFAPTASDNCPGVTTVCAPASGSTFAKGVTTVTCTATDTSSHTANCSFTVTVNDTQAPSITCPANITKGTDPNVCSAVVTFAPTASDNCPGVTTACTPPSGSVFAKGTVTVNCTATDGSNNTASCSFTVTVNDTQAPSITCPANVSVPAAPGLCSAVVTYSAPAVSDNCPGVGAPTCAPPSGSTFPKGTTTVTCSVKDAVNNQSNCSFGVTVVDTQLPVITCPANIVLATVNPGGLAATATFAATATDNCPGVAVVCVPASGSSFARGTTTVTCTATDTSANHASCSFTVRVFDYVIVDDATGRILRINSVTGDYDFFDCTKGTSLSGRGVVTVTGCKADLKDTGPDSKHPDRNVVASANSCTKIGTATITFASVTSTLSDSNMSNNIAKCP